MKNNQIITNTFKNIKIIYIIYLISIFLTSYLTIIILQKYNITLFIIEIINTLYLTIVNITSSIWYVIKLYFKIKFDTRIVLCEPSEMVEWIKIYPRELRVIRLDDIPNNNLTNIFSKILTGEPNRIVWYEPEYQYEKKGHFLLKVPVYLEELSFRFKGEHQMHEFDRFWPEEGGKLPIKEEYTLKLRKVLGIISPQRLVVYYPTN